MDIVVDQFIKCLVDMKTGALVDTVFAKMSILELNTITGWAFQWTALGLKDI